jgi:hypothetical protein
MLENGINDLNVAYKLFVVDDEQKLIERKHADEIKAAREEGARNFATMHHIPESGSGFRRIDSPLTRAWRPATPASVSDALPTPIASTATAAMQQPTSVMNMNAQAARIAASNEYHNDGSDIRTRMQRNFETALSKP